MWLKVAADAKFLNKMKVTQKFTAADISASISAVEKKSFNLGLLSLAHVIDLTTTWTSKKVQNAALHVDCDSMQAR